MQHHTACSCKIDFFCCYMKLSKAHKHNQRLNPSINNRKDITIMPSNPRHFWPFIDCHSPRADTQDSNRRWMEGLKWHNLTNATCLEIRKALVDGSSVTSWTLAPFSCIWASFVVIRDKCLDSLHNSTIALRHIKHLTLCLVAAFVTQDIYSIREVYLNLALHYPTCTFPPRASLSATTALIISACFSHPKPSNDSTSQLLLLRIRFMI